MIQDIAIEQLDIHPQNVRKVYTDIDELAESIKARGVMQNLTVVPNPDKKDHYLVVIGNRRLTAEPYEATDYYGHYEKGMKCLRDFYRLLQQMGFSFRSLEELKILNGTHELYTQETEDEH